MPDLQNFHPVVNLMHRIQASGNEFPKVRLAFGEEKLSLTVAGSRARNPGAVKLTDGRKYPAGTYYGEILPAGEFRPARAARNLDPALKRLLWELLCRMRDGEAETVFAEFGKRFGTCCMCGRELTNAESVKLGIGPICRNKAFG